MRVIPSPGPCNDLIEITPGDNGAGPANGEVPAGCRGFYITGGGTFSFVNSKDEPRTLTLPTCVLPLYGVQRIMAATTCTGIIALVDA